MGNFFNKILNSDDSDNEYVDENKAQKKIKNKKDRFLNEEDDNIELNDDDDQYDIEEEKEEKEVKRKRKTKSKRSPQKKSYKNRK